MIVILLSSFKPVLNDWCNKGRGKCYPVYGVVHMKEPLLLIGKSGLCGGSGFPVSLSCPLPYVGSNVNLFCVLISRSTPVNI